MSLHKFNYNTASIIISKLREGDATAITMTVRLEQENMA